MTLYRTHVLQYVFWFDIFKMVVLINLEKHQL